MHFQIGMSAALRSIEKKTACWSFNRLRIWVEKDTVAPRIIIISLGNRKLEVTLLTWDMKIDEVDIKFMISKRQWKGTKAFEVIGMTQTSDT